MGLPFPTPRTRSLAEWEHCLSGQFANFYWQYQTVAEVISARVFSPGPTQSPMDARIIGAVRRLGHFYKKQEEIWNYLRSFWSVFWRENSCKFSSLQEKTLASMTRYIVKYWSFEDHTMPTDCTNLSCTRPYEIRPMNPLQFFEHFCNRCVLPKLLGFAEMLEISTLVDFSPKLFRRWNVPWGVPFIFL